MTDPDWNPLSWQKTNFGLENGTPDYDYFDVDNPVDTAGSPDLGAKGTHRAAADDGLEELPGHNDEEEQDTISDLPPQFGDRKFAARRARQHTPIDTKPEVASSRTTSARRPKPQPWSRKRVTFTWLVRRAVRSVQQVPANSPQIGRRFDNRPYILDTIKTEHVELKTLAVSTAADVLPDDIEFNRVERKAFLHVTDDRYPEIRGFKQDKLKHDDIFSAPNMMLTCNDDTRDYFHHQLVVVSVDNGSLQLGVIYDPDRDTNERETSSGGVVDLSDDDDEDELLRPGRHNPRVMDERGAGRAGRQCSSNNTNSPGGHLMSEQDATPVNTNKRKSETIDLTGSDDDTPSKPARRASEPPLV